MAYSSDMTWIITGANGYLGGRVVEAFRAAGHPYIGFDLIPSTDENIHQLDVSDIEYFFESQKITPQSISGIMHLAALKNAAESNMEPEKYWVSNFDNTVSLFNFALKKGIEKFVFASSAAVYAPKSESRIFENDQCLPSSVYGITKLAAEKYIHGESFKDKIQVTSLRISNMIGANSSDLEKEDWSNFPFRIIGSLSKKMPLTIYHLKQDPTKFGVRDYVDVRDVANAFVSAAHSPRGLGEINICTGVETSSLDLIIEFEKEMKQKIDYSISNPLFDEVPICVGDYSKARDLLKWSPAYSGSETVSQIITDCSLR